MSVGTSEIQFVGFGLLGDQDHKARSFVSIKNYELFSGSQPVPGACTTCAWARPTTTTSA